MPPASRRVRVDDLEVRPVTNNRRWIGSGVLLLCLLLVAGPAPAKNPQAKQAKEELEFGYKAAKRGYWQEALERFEIADELTPNQPRILNNIAVALEANGRFDEARLAYQAGLALDPKNSALRKNFERFEEFFQTFVAVDDEDDDHDEPEAGAGGSDDGD
jgi:tetratricopeptide (TPR) repeat protein